MHSQEQFTNTNQSENISKQSFSVEMSPCERQAMKIEVLNNQIIAFFRSNYPSSKLLMQKKLVMYFIKLMEKLQL